MGFQRPVSIYTRAIFLVTVLLVFVGRGLARPQAGNHAAVQAGFNEATIRGRLEESEGQIYQKQIQMQDGQYWFKYWTGDMGREERRGDDGTVEGSYSHVDPSDGHLVHVQYRAGAKTGFQIIPNNPDTPTNFIKGDVSHIDDMTENQQEPTLQLRDGFLPGRLYQLTNSGLPYYMFAISPNENDDSSGVGLSKRAELTGSQTHDGRHDAQIPRRPGTESEAELREEMDASKPVYLELSKTGPESDQIPDGSEVEPLVFTPYFPLPFYPHSNPT